MKKRRNEEMKTWKNEETKRRRHEERKKRRNEETHKSRNDDFLDLKNSFINRLLMVWSMAQGSWLMLLGSWLKAHGQEKIGARARGLGDPAPNFSWP